MHPVVRAQLDEFSANYPDEPLSQSDFFEIYSIHSIENGLLGHDIDPFKVRLGNPEFGIDGISILLQGDLCLDIDQVDDALSVGRNHVVEFHFFQSKTSTRSKYGDISIFLDAVFNFFEDGHISGGSQLEDLRACKDRIYETPSKRNPIIRCFYCTTGTGETSNRTKQLVNNSIKRLDDLSLFSDIEISILGAKSLQDGYRSATNSISTDFQFQKAITLPEHPAVDEAFIGVVSARELLKLAISKGSKPDDDRINRAVFYDNIRDFDPQSEINQTILKELSEGSDRSFVFKNNGVTVVAREISRRSDTYHLEDYQIVNGCQTTNVLFMACDKIDDVSVPMRLIGSKDTDFVASIIVGTNQQNRVRDDQFWALLPFMKDLEEYCNAQPVENRILVERRENQYRDIKVERTRVFKPAELMKAIAATYLGQPHRAARDYRRVMKDFKEDIFQASHNVELYHLAAMCSYKFDFAVRNRRVSRSWGIYKHYALFAVVRNIWRGGNLLNASLNDQRRVASEVNALLEDEESWIEHIECVSEILDARIQRQGLTTREQVRDYIRRDAALSAFDRRIRRRQQ